jgi:hypothetical protein
MWWRRSSTPGAGSRPGGRSSAGRASAPARPAGLGPPARRSVTSAAATRWCPRGASAAPWGLRANLPATWRPPTRVERRRHRALQERGRPLRRAAAQRRERHSRPAWGRSPHLHPCAGGHARLHACVHSMRPAAAPPHRPQRARCHHPPRPAVPRVRLGAAWASCRSASTLAHRPSTAATSAGLAP